MAVQSRKWKCDICGLLVDLLPEKKPKIEVKAEIKVEPVIEDNKSESSGNQISETEGSRTRSKTKIKKVDLDRKSHLSNIEGVIFEDINEYAENEEEGDIHIKRSLTDLKEKIVINNEQVVNINSNKDSQLKKSKSDETINQEGNFNDYLKQLRQSQFAQENLNKSPKKEEIINTIPEINFKPKKEIPMEENVIKNPLHNIVNEESQFYEIISTIKCLKSKDPNELLEELKEEEQQDNNFGKIKDNLNLFDEFIKNLECKVQNKNIKENIKTNPDDIINFIDGKDKIEKLLKQKNNALKYLTQKSYKETRTNTLRGVNIFMVCTIILVFVCYHFGRNYF